jgi:hypothetical protein
MQRNDGIAIRNLRSGGCGNAGHYGKKWRQRFLKHRERVNIGCRELQHVGMSAHGFQYPSQKMALARAPGNHF